MDPMGYELSHLFIFVKKNYPLVMTNIAMENGLFIDDFPAIETSIYGWDFPWRTVSHKQMVILYVPGLTPMGQLKNHMDGPVRVAKAMF